VNAERLLVNAANNSVPHDVFLQQLKPVCDHFTSDLGSNRLIVQLQMLPELVGHSHVVRLESIIQALNALGDSKQLYSAVCALIRLLLTLPATTTTAERSFSCV